MAECDKDCYQIVTEITSYNIDFQRSDCPGTWEQEIADHVAAWIRAHNNSVEEHKCAEGCICVPYARPQPPIPLAPRNVTTRLGWVGGGLAPGGGRCIYVAVVTYQIRESKIPVGICRPRQPFAAVRSELLPGGEIASLPGPAIEMPKRRGKSKAKRRRT